MALGLGLWAIAFGGGRHDAEWLGLWDCSATLGPPHCFGAVPGLKNAEKSAKITKISHYGPDNPCRRRNVHGASEIRSHLCGDRWGFGLVV